MENFKKIPAGVLCCVDVALFQKQNEFFLFFHFSGAINVWALFVALVAVVAPLSKIFVELIDEELVPVESLDDVVSWHCSSNNSESDCIVGSGWFCSVRSPVLDVLSTSLNTSSAVSSNTFEHFIWPTCLKTKNVNKSDSEITPITWSSLSTMIIRWTWLGK